MRMQYPSGFVERLLPFSLESVARVNTKFNGRAFNPTQALHVTRAQNPGDNHAPIP